MLERHGLDAAAQRAGLVAASPARAGREVDHGVAAPGDALVELHDRRGHRRPLRAHAGERVGHALDVAHVLLAERVQDAGLGEQPPAAGLRAEREQARVGAEERDAEREREVALERSSSSTGRGGSASGPGSGARTSSSTRGRSISFAASARGVPSCVATMCRRARAWLGITPGSSER